MSFVGVNIGALTVKVVAILGDPCGGCRSARVVPHLGRPTDVLGRLLAEPEFVDAESFGVSGQLGHITEVEALRRALLEVPASFDAVASLGGETFLVYLLTDGRITNVLSHNRCAAGSGEFFVQQIGRMGLEIDEAIRLSSRGKVVPLASRCSVHCKSDITHKLNRAEAAVEDVLHTLHDGMANKVVSLLEKAPKGLRRVLLIGGMTRNAAMLAALRDKCPEAELVVLPESPWFEAWGSALLARDSLPCPSPRLSPQPRLASLPPLRDAEALVSILPSRRAEEVHRGPLVLGLDAGSTTTKAVLLDPETKAVVASHYTRTQGDPVTAARECLRALAARVGEVRVGLSATTGSARELIGAYLGTDQVYNEISAHAAGAAHHDLGVDTIFEIGGQDSKYILLRNGVPVEYAMNNACSAGTGSFLEESARGDLGIGVSEIAGAALAAESPVQFRATCAAFINSDIRAAQQQGHASGDIVAGLVYAIAENFLGRVKGPRPVGKKVFLQGGVALNHAVARAFAQLVGRPVVVPPDPELLGALGVALLALERFGRALRPQGEELLELAVQEMRVVSRFTCRACKLYCNVDRFEVAGRRFPFGGRCSRYESFWKRTEHGDDAPDLVEERAAIIFGHHAPHAPAGAPRIGIPRALTAHSLFPLYSTFLAALGVDVVLSNVDPRGDMKSYSGFCFPVQVAHGAVLDLAQMGVRVVFLPHVMRMPSSGVCRDSYLCPLSQGGPYVLAKAFPDLRFLTPVLDFSRGYGPAEALVDLAVREMGAERELARQAVAAAVKAQEEADGALLALGRRALEEAAASDKPAVLLAGRAYNAFTPEASQSVGRKLASMGVMAIPADCLLPNGDGATAWHFANQTLNAAAYARRHANLFFLGVSNFSCTVDAFAHARLASEMGPKPSLVLEIDAHTADAGVQTRLEAFLDIVHSYREGEATAGRPFSACRLAPGGTVVRSNGERVKLTDPLVKLHFPNFSTYHSEAFGAATGWLGLHAGEPPALGLEQLELGLQHTSGRECLPLPICAGQLLQAHADRPAGEVLGFYILTGGAPCVSDSYQEYFERFIVEQRLEDVFLFDYGAKDGHLGIDPATVTRSLAPAIVLADILVEIENVLRVVGMPGSLDALRRHWREFLAAAPSLDQLRLALPRFIDRVAAIPRSRRPGDCPCVVVTGDFFTRFSPFFMEGVRDRYAERGIILKPVDLADLYLHGIYNGVSQAAEGLGMKPGGFALARACTRIYEPVGQQFLQRWLGFQLGRRSEERFRDAFQRTGLLVAGANDVAALVERAAEHVSPRIAGEVVPTVGKGANAEREGYDGIIVIGPFNCLPYRVSEAILRPLSLRQGMPILTYESDGYAVSPSLLRQVDVHLHQVLEHAARSRKTRR